MLFKKQFKHLHVQLTLQAVNFLLIGLLISIVTMNWLARTHFYSRLDVDLAAIADVSKYVVEVSKYNEVIEDETNGMLQHAAKLGLDYILQNQSINSKGLQKIAEQYSMNFLGVVKWDETSNKFSDPLYYTNETIYENLPVTWKQLAKNARDIIIKGENGPTGFLADETWISPYVENQHINYQGVFYKYAVAYDKESGYGVFTVLTNIEKSQAKGHANTNQILQNISNDNPMVEEIALIRLCEVCDNSFNVSYGSYTYHTNNDVMNISKAIDTQEKVSTRIYGSGHRTLRKFFIPVDHQQVAVVVFNDDNARGLVNTVTLYESIIYGIAILIIAGWIFYIIKKRLRPFRALQEHLQQVSKGDFSGRIQLQSNDEFADLAIDINEMTLSMEKMVNQINEQAEEDVRSTEQIYRREIQSLLVSVDSSRHDLRNHMNVLHGMMGMGTYDEVKIYMDQLFEEYKIIERSEIKSKNPAVSVLIMNKTAIAENLKIAFETDIDCDKFDLMKSTDLIKLLSNLIDNAFEAVKEHNGARTVGVSLKKKTRRFYQLDVWNTGPAITDEVKDKIFERGFTTKELSSTALNQSRGHGLAIVKDLIDKYDGEIWVESNSKKTLFSVLIPVNNSVVKQQSGIGPENQENVQVV